MEKEINMFEKLIGSTEEKAPMTNSMPDSPLERTPVDRMAKEVIVHITIVSINTSNVPHRPC